MALDIPLARLLEHPGIWRGRSSAQISTLATGFAALDDYLPGRGWPRAGLIEILIPRLGIGELYLLLPALASLTRARCARWCAWIAPPFEPFAPALASHGLLLEHLLIVRAPTSLWALEQALRCGACDAALAWVRQAQPRDLRRLQLAAEHGRTLGVMFRALKAARAPSSAAVRIALEPLEQGARLSLLKNRGGARGSIDLHWSS
jgi:hypothetical protein